MRLFKGIKDTYKKSEAAVIAQNLLTIFSKNHMFSGDPAQVANKIIGEIWEEIPNILNGESGARPHKFTVAALAFANAIKMNDSRFPTSDSHIYALCIGKIMMEIEENGHKYPLSMLDHNLLTRSTEAYIEFTESSSSTPLAREVSKILEKSGPDADTQRRRNPSEGLRFFNSMHRVDDAYLNDILGISTPTGKAADDMHRMCDIVGSAVAPLQMMAMLSGGSGSPHNEETVGYLFGWLDVFKTHIWRVSDFNRSFFHYGFCLWFNDQTGKNSEARMQAAMDAMTCLGTNITSPQGKWLASAQRGADEARAFLGDFSAEQRAVSGVVVYVDREGSIHACEGLVRPEDKAAARAAGLLGGGGQGDEEEKPKSPISNALADDLRRAVTGARQHAALRDPDLLLALLAYQRPLPSSRAATLSSSAATGARTRPRLPADLMVSIAGLILGPDLRVDTLPH